MSEQNATSRAFGRAAAVLIVGLSLGAAALSNPKQLVLTLVLATSYMSIGVLGLTLPRGGALRLDGGISTAAIMLAAPIPAVLAAVAGSIASDLLVDHREGGLGKLLVDSARRASALAIVACSYAVVVRPVEPVGADARWIALCLAVGIAYMVLDLGSYAVLYSGRTGASWTQSFEGIVRLVGSVYLGQVSVGAVMVIIYSNLGAVGFAVLVVLLLIMQHTFALLLRVRQAYMKTVGALSRVAEYRSPARQGHAERVARLAAVIGRRMRLKPAEIERLTLAALLHDIGRIKFDDELTGPHEPRRAATAAAGAEIVSQVGFLATLAPVIVLHPVSSVDHVDFRNMDGVLARILHVASDLDDLTHYGVSGDSMSEAIEMISSCAGEEYDPVVVLALEKAHSAGELA